MDNKVSLELIEFQNKILKKEFCFEDFQSIYKNERYQDKEINYLKDTFKIDEYIKEEVIGRKGGNYSYYIEILKLYSYYLIERSYSVKKNDGYKKVVKGLSTSQLRSIFDIVKKVEKNIRKLKDDNDEEFKKEINKLVKLRLNIAYLQGKNKENDIFINFLDVIESYILQISTSKNPKDDVKEFFEFLEGIVCYLKYFKEIGGK